MQIFWNVRQLSRHLDIDERLIGRAVAKLTSVTLDGRQCFDIAEAVPLILKRRWGLDQADDPAKLQPWDRLRHYQAERERLAVARAAEALLPKAEVAEVMTAALGMVDPALAALDNELAGELEPDAAALASRQLAACGSRLRDSWEQYLK